VAGVGRALTLAVVTPPIRTCSAAGGSTGPASPVVALRIDTPVREPVVVAVRRLAVDPAFGGDLRERVVLARDQAAQEQLPQSKPALHRTGPLQAPHRGRNVHHHDRGNDRKESQNTSGKSRTSPKIIRPFS
jgi:hypothetical protein